MNTTPTTYFRIGLFVLISLALLVAALIVFGAGKLFQQRVMFETYVDGSVQGVDVGSPVKFRGVTIGRVAGVGFIFNEYPSAREGEYNNFVRLVMEVTKPVFPDMFTADLRTIVNSAVQRGLRVRIEPQGITGMSYMEIDYTRPGTFPPLEVSWTPEYYYIPSAPGQLTSILDSVNKIMADIENLNLAGIGDETVALLKNMNRAVEEAELGRVSRQARQLFRDLEGAIADANLRQLSADARAAMEEIRAVSAETKRILDNLEPATRLNSDDINASLSNMRIITDNLRVISTDARRYPSRLFFSSPPPHSSVMGEPAPSGPGPTRD